MEGNTHSPDVVVARNDHPNEKAAFELAGQIYRELERQGYEVTLETRPAAPLADTILEAEENNRRLGREEVERAVDYIPGERWEGSLVDRYPDAAIISFHNYPANADELPVEIYNVGDVESDGWRRTRWYVDEARKDGYRFIEFLDGNDLIHVEVPAVYETQLPEGIRGAIERQVVDSDALRNLDTYMYDADVEESREEGFLDIEVVDLVVDEVAQMV